MQRSSLLHIFSRPAWVAGLFIAILSFFTYVHNFSTPQALFWDENYHIASAQKYINGVFFMEPHPPLGKLVIALGEKLFDFNAVDDSFIGTDYATNPPAGFSFTGYRFFPVMLAWWTAIVLYGIFLLLTKKPLWATLLSFLYVFDNALIVHQRAAMLESTMLFFSALTILAFLLLRTMADRPRLFLWISALFGVSFACLMTTKVFGLIFILLIPFLLYELQDRKELWWKFLCMAGGSFLIVYAAIWQIHFTLGSRIVPELPDQGYYQASQEYKAILAQGANGSPFAFPVMLRDSLAFVSHYQKGVPRLDLCKSDENGSPWYFWPVGARAINYRWETPDGQGYRYLFLQVNPVVWAIAFGGVLLSALLLLASFLLPVEHAPRARNLLLAFLTLYVCYLAAISRIDRVMYLYHYFLPLLFSFLLFTLSFLEIERIGSWKFNQERRTALLLLLGVGIFLSFEFYRPLTYYTALSDKAFERRDLLRLWDLHCVRCIRDNPLVIPAS